MEAGAESPQDQMRVGVEFGDVVLPHGKNYPHIRKGFQCFVELFDERLCFPPSPSMGREKFLGLIQNENDGQRFFLFLLRGVKFL